MKIVSVIIPTYNRAHCIERALKSVQKQTFTDMEILVCDDASTDSTRDIVRAYQVNDSRIRLLCHSENQGAGAARNLGLEVARGEYIAFLDSDDEWLPEKLEKQVTLMESLTNDWGICHTGAYIRKNYNRALLFKPREDYNGDVFHLYVLGKLRFLTPTLIVRKICFENTGIFDEKLLRGQDVELLFRVLMLYKLAVIPNPLTIVNLQTDKLSSSTFTDQLESSRLSILEKHEKVVQQRLGHKTARYFRARSFWLIADGKFRSCNYLRGMNYLLRSIIINPLISPIKYCKMFAIIFRLDKFVR